MKNHKMGLNSFNEHQWNTQFAGRNWNGGEVIELVLRRRDGKFLPIEYLLNVMAHELAHIHHSPKFQKLNAQIRQEINDLRRKGYFGPGFWSSGQRLADSAKLSGDAPLTAFDLPEYTCGGSRAEGSRRRVYRPKSTTQARRKPKKADRFIGEGQRLETAGASFFRKRAGAAGAKEARARAAEQRALNSKMKSKTTPVIELIESEDEITKEDRIELESDWEEDLESNLNNFPSAEAEKESLRDEMKLLLETYQHRSSSSSSKTPIILDVESIEKIDDDIEIVKPNGEARESHKRNHNSELQDLGRTKKQKKSE